MTGLLASLRAAWRSLVEWWQDDELPEDEPIVIRFAPGPIEPDEVCAWNPDE